MVMKNSRSLSYLAEYQYGDDNILTATYHEELRLRNEARVRGAQPALRLQDLTLSDDSHAINKAKRVQQELGAFSVTVVAWSGSSLRSH
jgi:hypothetical protein